MKSGKLILVGCVLLAAVSTARANSITLYKNAYTYGSGNTYGGEFLAYTTPDNFAADYASVATMAGGFETFCEQANVNFYLGQTYSYALVNQDSQGRSVSLGAAFLYYEFATGALSGYNYTSSYTRLLNAGQLQAAIWWFQGNQTLSGWPSISTDPFYNLAITDLGTAAFGANDGTYNVDLLQLYTAAGAPAQAQFVVPSQCVPAVPETGATIVMFAFACGALVALRGCIRQHGFTPS
jgi:hypothetical protein